MLGLVQTHNLLPRFKVFIRLRSVRLTVLINLEWSRQVFSLSSIPVAVSAETCPEVLAVRFFQACIIKVITRNTVYVPASFPLCLTLNHTCNFCHYLVICLAVSTCWLEFKKNRELFKKPIFHYSVRTGSFLTSSDTCLKSKWQMMPFFFFFFILSAMVAGVCNMLCVPCELRTWLLGAVEQTDAVTALKTAWNFSILKREEELPTLSDPGHLTLNPQWFQQWWNWIVWEVLFEGTWENTRPGNWRRQAKGIKMHSMITWAVQEGELNLTNRPANNKTSKRARPSLPQLCFATEKRQGVFQWKFASYLCLGEEVQKALKLT